MTQRTDHGLPGIYNATTLTMIDGTGAALALDGSGIAKFNNAYLHAGEDLAANVQEVEHRYSPAVISTATTTVIKTGAGFLHNIVVTGGTAGTIVVYDNTAASGTQLYNFDSTNAIAPYLCDVIFSVGLTVITSAATKLTLGYR